jgi:transglutaminase-like putative cysteine protease
VTRRYRIEHRTEYRYSDEVSTSFGRGYLRPREIPGRQRCLAYSLTIDPDPSDLTHDIDVFGNPNSYFHVTHAHTELVVTGLSEVEVTVPEFDAGVLDQPWERARPSGFDDPKAVEFTLASPLVRMPVQIHEYALRTFAEHRPIGEAIVDLTHRIFTEFKYHPGSTTVSSTVADVLEARAGVCQDFAHVAVACLRSVGLACRYVSGYLATDPPPGKDRMVGADASHAWAAVRLPDGSWLGFDPTNDQLADERYTIVAWGRDYDDVPPLRGVIYTDAESHEMDVSVDVAPLAAG